MSQGIEVASRSWKRERYVFSLTASSMGHSSPPWWHLGFSDRHVEAALLTP